MNCFTDYIGLRGSVSGIIPESGLYINDLPGISLKSIDAIADSDQVTYAQLWNKIQLRAIKKFQTEVYATLNKRYRIKTLLQSIDLLKQIDTTMTYPAIAQYRGFTIELTFKNMQRLVASPFQTVSIQEVSLYLSAIPASDIAVKIFDLNTGTVMDIFTIPIATAIVGWNRVKVNKKYPSYRIFCGYDATQITGVNLYIPPSSIDMCSTCTNSIYGFAFCNAYIRGAQTIVAGDYSDLVFTNQSYGLSGVFSVGCSYDALTCNNKELFANAFWYLLGAEIMIERINSDRINRYTTVDKPQAEKNLTYFQSEYSTFLTQACDGINLSMNDSCIECNAPVTFREMATI